MHKDNSAENRSASQDNLDERLAKYYGPALPETPLSSDAWLQVRSQLSPSRKRKLHFHWPRMRRIRQSNLPPTYLQQSFSRILYEARVPFNSSMLGCASGKFRHLPRVQVTPFGRRKIMLLLPAASSRTLEPVELDVLLATGLARYQRRYSHRSPYLFVCLLPWCLSILAYVAFFIFGRQHLPLLTIPTAITLLASIIIHREGRQTAFQADALMTQWLGRATACRGLHALAARHRRPQAKTWGCVSYAERIERVCGTPVTVADERFTLVR